MNKCLNYYIIVLVKLLLKIKEEVEEMKKTFMQVFGKEATDTYFSPGRINLIGEHTDYNGGNVFPAAITIGTYGLSCKREDRLFRFYSENFSDLGIIDVSLDDVSYDEADTWVNYPKGMLAFLIEEGHDITHGLDIYINGNIPNGAGLSSSASLELLMGEMLKDNFELSVSRLELIQLGKKTENEFIGVNSGIMDQFAIGMGKKDQAILLNTDTLEYELVPADFKEYLVVIMNTNKRRELADSKYNERRGECDEALSYLKKETAISYLCELDLATFNQHSHVLPTDTLRRRAKHAVSENERTLLAKEALVKGDLTAFGQLLNASHASLKTDYEVTGLELDTLVASAQKQEGVLGARMTGAGFGGCGIALVKEDMLASFKEKVGQEYLEKIGYSADFYEAKIGDGTTKK